MRYHPWRAVPERVDIAFVDDLPAGVRGRTCGQRIEINSRLLSAERRSAVTHELVHVERGVHDLTGVALAREESIVERTAARRLIALDQLIDVLRWTRHAPEVADELWVDVPMLEAFVDDLTSDERATIRRALADIEVA